MSDAPSRPPPPKHQPPKGAPEHWEIEDLKNHLITAVILELHTIPLYLCSAYAVNLNPGAPDAQAKARDAASKFIGVVKQEMLHLGLAGNILASIGGTPTIYGLESTPEYPCQIFYDPIDLNLTPPNPEAIEGFVRLEAPLPPVRAPRGNIMPGYDSIGAFYESLKQGIKSVNADYEKQGKNLFDPQYKDRQFTADDGAYPDGGMIQIQNLTDALNAMELIIEQGEGTNVTTPAAAGQEKSHWQIFVSLVGVDIPYYDTVENPKTDDPTFSDNIKKAMRAFDAVYCYLLLSIEKVWTDTTHRDDLLGNISDIMSGALKPIAQFIVTQKVNDAEGSKNAPPPFNFYQFGSIESAKEDTIKELTAAKDAYGSPTQLSRALRTANGLFDLKDLNT